MKKGKGLYIAVGNETAQDIPTIEMLKKLCCKPDTKAETLPDNLGKIHEKTIHAYRMFFDRMLTANQGNKNRTTALGIIKQMINSTTDAETKQILKTARKMVERGNSSLTQKIIKLNEIANQSTLFPVGINDFDGLIQQELAALKNRADSQSGKPEIQISMTNI
jgi:hypothetical protein